MWEFACTVISPLVILGVIVYIWINAFVRYRSEETKNSNIDSITPDNFFWFLTGDMLNRSNDKYDHNDDNDF